MRTRDNRWLALAVVCLGQLMMILDATIVAVALPAIKTDLAFSASSLTWVPNAYLIAFGSFLLLGGRLADLIGRTRMFLAGIAIFTGASIGLITGGLLTQALDWHWIFFINLPIGIAAFALGLVTLERDRGLGFGHDVDVIGSALITVASMVAIYAIVGSEEHGLVWALRLGAVAVALLAAFLAYERHNENPILPLDIMRLRSLMVASSVRALMVCGMWATFFVGALYLQRVLGMGPIAAGAAFLPQTLTVAALSLGPSARLTARFGERRVLLAGLSVLVVGLIVFALALQPGASYFPGPAIAFTLIGLGAGLSFMTLMTLALADVPARDAGIASGVVNVSTQISAAVGLAVLGTIASSRTNALGADGESAIQALSGGYQLAFIVAAGCVAAALVAAIAWMRAPVAEPEVETEHEFELAA